MPKLNAPAEIHWRRSNMNTRDPILMKSVEVLKDCRSLNAAAEMNCPMPRSVEKVPIRNEKRCSASHPSQRPTNDRFQYQQNSMYKNRSTSKNKSSETTVSLSRHIATMPSGRLSGRGWVPLLSQPTDRVAKRQHTLNTPHGTPPHLSHRIVPRSTQNTHPPHIMPHRSPYPSTLHKTRPNHSIRQFTSPFNTAPHCSGPVQPRVVRLGLYAVYLQFVSR